MSDFPALQGASSKIKSFWERPEGTTGLVTLGLFALGIFFLGQAVFPSILGWLTLATAIVGKTIVLAALCGFIGIVSAVLLNKRFQTLCGFLFKNSMRKLTSIVIETDPIGIMKSYIETLHDKKEKFDSNKLSLKGQIRLCMNQIDQIGIEIRKDTALAAAARDKGNRGQLNVHGRNMERNTEQVERMKGTLSKMEMLYQFLCKYSDATDLVIQDMENDVRARERDRQFSTTANNAMRSAWGILKGEGVGREMYDEAMEYALADYANKMGEIEDFMTSTQSIMEGIDLQNGVWEKNALEKLNSFESKTESLLLGGEKRLMLENASSNLTVGTVQYDREPVSVNGDFQKFFK